MPTTANTPKSTRHTARPGAVKPVKSTKAPSKAGKPTKWGKDMLAKMEAFRRALAAQR